MKTGTQLDISVILVTDLNPVYITEFVVPITALAVCLVTLFSEK